MLLQSKVPPEERWEQIPAVAVESQAARSPLLLLIPTNQTLPLMLSQVVAFPLSPLPLSHPLVFLSADGWAGSLPTASPGLVPPLHWLDHGEHMWELSQGQSRQAGETKLGLPSSPLAAGDASLLE